MTASILLHGLLGSSLAVVVYAVGLGCLGRFPHAALFAYAPGLLVVSAASLLVLLEAWLAPVAAVLVVVPLARVLSDRPRTKALAARAVRPVAWSLMPALGLALVLGRLNHGPTETEPSSAYGDMLFYAGKVVSAAQSLVPFRDLTVAGEGHVFVESAWIFQGALLSHLPGFDPVLFQAASAPAFLVTAIAIGAGFLLQPDSGTTWLLAPAVLAVAAIPYPSWITETPPVALAVPLGFAIYGLWRERLSAGWLGALLLILGADLYLTKGFGVIPLGVVAAVVVLRDHSRYLLYYALAGAALAVAGAVVFFQTGAWLVDFFRFEFRLFEAFEGLWGQLETRNAREAAPAAAVAGQLLLAVALARARAYTLLATLAVSVLGNLVVAGHRMDITVGLSILLAALFFIESGDLRSQRWPVAGAALAFAFSAWFRDLVAARTGLALVSLLACGLVLAMTQRRPLVVGVCGTCVVGALALGPSTRQATLTPAAYSVWQRVHDVVPADGLVFTSLTGDAIFGDQGWNYYPAVAGRQVYLAGWSNSPLLVDQTERRRRLELNRRVLTGAESPHVLGLDDEFTQAYAVLRASEPVPHTFRSVYRNAEFALYRIES